MLDLLLFPGVAQALSPVTDTFVALTDTAGIVVDSAIQATAGEGNNITHRMMMVVLQIGILIFAAHIGGRLATMCKLPGVLGELVAGIIVGPYLLGALPIPGLLAHGIFPPPLLEGGLSVSPELYSFATIASIILLFMTGLETDLEMFLRYSVAGSVIGFGGALVSMLAGMAVGPLLFDVSFTSPLSLFLGVLCTATSVGITARILSEKRKIDSSEGVTILAAAVIDDVLGIICLAVVVGITDTQGNSGATVAWGDVGITALKAVGTWLFFTIGGLLIARKLGAFLKRNYAITTIVAAALGLALVLSAFFEMAGLALIIGAYVMGLILSKTDLKFMLLERLHDIYVFFVPVFFAVMGALVDVKQLFDPKVLMIGGIYTALAVAAKVIGCSLPALALRFNFLGAMRIGVGMIPRGEVALIIAGIGISKGILDQSSFGVGIMMTLLSTVVAPPLLSWLLSNPRKGTRGELEPATAQSIVFDFPHPLIMDMMIDKLHQTFSQEGFFITRTELEHKTYQMCKDDVAFSMIATDENLEFTAPPKEAFFIKTAVNETLLDIMHSIEFIKDMNKPEVIRESMADAVRSALPASAPQRNDNPFVNAIRLDCIRLNLTATDTKANAIRELVNILGDAGVIPDRDTLFDAVMKREQQVTTGLQDGIAVPHARIDGIDEVHAAIGIIPDGMDFEALDGNPTKLIVLLASPAHHSATHLQCLATLGSMALTPGFMEAILAAKNFKDVYAVFCPDCKKVK